MDSHALCRGYTGKLYIPTPIFALFVYLLVYEKEGPCIPRRYFVTDLDLISAQRIRLPLLVTPGTIGTLTLSVPRKKERPRVIDSKQVARYGGEVVRFVGQSVGWREHARYALDAQRGKSVPSLTLILSLALIVSLDCIPR
jgi:hypothetical protein